MIFDTKIAGIPCQCKVFHYSPPVPMHIYGPGMGDADPPEPAEFEYKILDRKGYPAPWLEKKIDRRMESELFEEIQLACMAERHGYEY